MAILAFKNSIQMDYCLALTLELFELFFIVLPEVLEDNTIKKASSCGRKMACKNARTIRS
jgi:hypothetical protein